MYIGHADECSSLNESAPPATKMHLYSAVNSTLYSKVFSAVYSKVESMAYRLVFLTMYKWQDEKAPDGIGQHCQPLGCLCTF